jgi:hypothetical protein
MTVTKLTIITSCLAFVAYVANAQVIGGRPTAGQSNAGTGTYATPSALPENANQETKGEENAEKPTQAIKHKAKAKSSDETAEEATSTEKGTNKKQQKHTDETSAESSDKQ